MKPRSFIRSEDGGGMVEFAMVGGLLSIIVLGICEFGLAAWSRSNVASDAREGARYAIVHSSRSGSTADSASVADYVKARSILGNAIRVRARWPNTKEPDSVVVVSVAFSVPRRGPFIPAHVDSSTSTMRIVY